MIRKIILKIINSKNKRENFYLFLLIVNLVVMVYGIHTQKMQQDQISETTALIDARGRVTVDSICAGLRAGKISSAQAEIYRQSWQIAKFDRVAPVEIISMCQSESQK